MTRRSALIRMPSSRNKRATTIQKWVRMHLQRARYRRDTIAGRRAAERAAAEARRLGAATVIQREARRWRAGRKVPSVLPYKMVCAECCWPFV